MLLTPDGHPDKPVILSNLGNPFRSRFERTKVPSDIEEAIKNGEQSVLLTPDGHAIQSSMFFNLGASFFSRFMHTQSTSDGHQAMTHYRSAATCNTGSPLDRLYSSQQWARLAANFDPPSALVACRRAMDLIPQLAWIGDPIGTRHSQINQLDDFPREVAALALYAGKPDLALQWLELGRSVVWNQLLDLRTSVDELRQAHPDICTEFTQNSKVQSLESLCGGRKHPFI